MRAGELFYEDVYYSCREQVLNVREDGPDAWGDCVDVPPDSFVRTIGYDGNPGKWHYVTEGERRWITMIGSNTSISGRIKALIGISAGRLSGDGRRTRFRMEENYEKG